MILNKDYRSMLKAGKRVDKVLLQRENDAGVIMFWCVFGSAMIILTVLIMEG
jgi:hypothetical protein